MAEELNKTGLEDPDLNDPNLDDDPGKEGEGDKGSGKENNQEGAGGGKGTDGKGQDGDDKDDDDAEEKIPEDPEERIEYEFQRSVEDRNAAMDLAKSVGLDGNELLSKFMEKGDLDSTDYDSLKKLGFSKSQIRTYFRGLHAENVRFQAKIIESVGGHEKYVGFAKYLQEQPEDIQNEFYEDVDSAGSLKQKIRTVKRYFAEYQQTTGKAPGTEEKGDINNLIDIRRRRMKMSEATGKTSKADVGGYKSWQEAVAAQDPAKGYGVDKEYTDTVNKKIMASNWVSEYIR